MQSLPLGLRKEVRKGIAIVRVAVKLKVMKGVVPSWRARR